MLRLFFMFFCAPHQNGSTNGLTQEWAVEVEAQSMVNRRKNLNLQSTRMWKKSNNRECISQQNGGITSKATSKKEGNKSLRIWWLFICIYIYIINILYIYIYIHVSILLGMGYKIIQETHRESVSERPTSTQRPFSPGALKSFAFLAQFCVTCGHAGTLW